MTIIIFNIFSCMEAKYSSECIAKTLQNYPELYKMEEAKVWHTMLQYYCHKNNNYVVRGSVWNVKVWSRGLRQSLSVVMTIIHISKERERAISAQFKKKKKQ